MRTMCGVLVLGLAFMTDATARGIGPASPLCGDGVVDPEWYEECDDGNAIDGDGCSLLCATASGPFGVGYLGCAGHATLPRNVPTSGAAGVAASIALALHPAMQEFRDRVAVVTGGASGIGLATAERLAREGMKLVLADVEEPALRKAADGLTARGARVLPVVTDVTQPEQVDALARRVFEHFGAVHVVFNNAGVEVTGAIFENSVADLRWVVDVNLFGVLYGIRSFVPRMLDAKSEGHVVSTASMAGLTTAPYLDIYCVTKFGVVAAMECLYKELVATGSSLRASVVCPGLIKTNLMQAERNRPTARGGAAAASAGGMAMDAMLRAGLETGYPPSVVADAVFEGIRDERFWVIPSQPELKVNIASRLDEIRDERNPAVVVAGLPDPR